MPERPTKRGGIIVIPRDFIEEFVRHLASGGPADSRIFKICWYGTEKDIQRKKLDLSPFGEGGGDLESVLWWDDVSDSLWVRLRDRTGRIVDLPEVPEMCTYPIIGRVTDVFE